MTLNRISAAYAGTALAFFVLPWYVPAPQGVFSLSARVGFSNAAAVLILLAGLCVMTLLRLTSPDQTPVAADVDRPDCSLGIGWLAAALTLVTIQTLFVAAYSSAGHPFYEESYFLNRMQHLQVGHLPYRDFEFVYGPLLVFLPHWFQRHADLPVHSAYSLAVGLSKGAGVFILWAIVRSARGALRKRTTFMVLAVFIGVSPLTLFELPLQYTPLRFLAGFGALLAFDRLSRRFPHQWLFRGPFAAALTFSVLMISPEIAIALAGSLITHMGLDMRTGSRSAGRALAVYLAIHVLAAFLLPADLLSSTGSFARGGSNFPVLPSAFILVYAGFMLTAIPLAAAAALRRQGSASLPFGASLTGAFAVNTVALMPGALGRADPLHVCMYGFSVFLMAFCGIRLTNALYTRCLAVFAAAVLWLSVSAFPWEFNQFRANAQRKIRADTPFDLSALDGYGKICAPFGEVDLSAALLERGSLAPEYYYGIPNIYTPEQIQRKLDGLLACRYIIVSRDAVWGNPPDTRAQEEDARYVFQTVLKFPFAGRLRVRKTPDPLTALSAYIRREYAEVKQLDPEFTLCRRIRND